MICSGISDEAGQPIEVQIKAHKQLGWNYMEVRNVDKENLSLMPDEKFEQVYAKIMESGMKVSCFGGCIGNWATAISGDFRKDVDELKMAIPRMQKLNTRFVRIMSWPNDKDNPWSEDDWAKEVIRRTKELAKMAEAGGIILAHENCSGWASQSPENSLRLVEEVSSPALKLLYDTGNPVHDVQDPWDFYSKVKEYVVYCHIKDYKKEGEKYEATFPGEGNGRVLEVIKDLLSIGYDGFLSIEPHMTSVVHKAEFGNENATFNNYITYGQKLISLMESMK